MQCSRCRLPAVLYSNFKSLQQAQVFFTDGWVKDLEIVKVGQKTVVRSKVLDPSICKKRPGPAAAT
ncbi:hypothetical protein DPX16_9612 [Anabarilius grahami]|uniref:Uncharacterized protein n=1 Tax=Anabarilius grahami TaxID=495550 RepID=A0A3N0Y8E4_ANAGA|nr:hypothetical protein DPX16_9612 [Anabarilius grahami]